MKSTKDQHWFTRLGGYLLIPHELLHVLGYRLVGKRCQYQWGNPYVTPVGPMSRGVQLTGMLFPFVVFFLLVTIFVILAGFASEQVVREGSFFWFIFWLGLSYIAGIYTGTTLGDLRRAYLLIFDKPWSSRTPFDFFFWPIVDWNDIRSQVASGEIDEPQD